MRPSVAVVFALSMLTGAAFAAAAALTPDEIKAKFFNGEPFTAASPSGAKFKMTFTPDGKTTRESLDPSAKKDTGTWKLTAKGFCTTWGHARPNCFTIIPSSENKWLIQKIATTIAVTVAVWSK
jgi:hypothetical protein